MTSHDVFSKWPSIAELARDIDEPYEKVRKWKVRDSIPSAHWLAITEAAKARGIDVSIDDLAAMHAKARAA